MRSRQEAPASGKQPQSLPLSNQAVLQVIVRVRPDNRRKLRNDELGSTAAIGQRQYIESS